MKLSALVVKCFLCFKNLYWLLKYHNFPGGAFCEVARQVGGRQLAFDNWPNTSGWRQVASNNLFVTSGED
jgi:hypothetical protein